MVKLSARAIPETREAMLRSQGWACALCKLRLEGREAVLDHDHATGYIRAVLHRGCNAMLGKVENNHKRYGIRNLSAFLHGCAEYLQKHETPQTDMLHPTHKTEEEKRLLRNKRAREARKTRAAKKGSDAD